jgi:hypothetical protein
MRPKSFALGQRLRQFVGLKCGTDGARFVSDFCGVHSGTRCKNGRRLLRTVWRVLRPLATVEKDTRRRPMQLGQKPRRRHENATGRHHLQSRHVAKISPCERIRSARRPPPRRSQTRVGPAARPPLQLADERLPVRLQRRVEDRLPGLVPFVVVCSEGARKVPGAMTDRDLVVRDWPAYAVTRRERPTTSRSTLRR